MLKHFEKQDILFSPQIKIQDSSITLLVENWNKLMHVPNIQGMHYIFSMNTEVGDEAIKSLNDKSRIKVC